MVVGRLLHTPGDEAVGCYIDHEQFGVGQGGFFYGPVLGEHEVPAVLRKTEVLKGGKITGEQQTADCNKDDNQESSSAHRNSYRQYRTVLDFL